jgi:hypothetical protein
MTDLELFEYFENDPGLDSYDSMPEYIISGSGYDWFYDPDDRGMARVLRGTECIPISFDEDSAGKITVRVPYRFIVLNSREVLKVGWN